MQVKHKDIIQSRNLAIRAEELIEYINEDPSFSMGLKSGRRLSKSRKEGGVRTPIEKPERKRAEKIYRRKAKKQTTMAGQNLDHDVIIEDISFCAWWDWRW